ncbi:MAG: fumarylacetoacetase [Gammaproteobacteria bacterium]|nr:fumarylacetoacetase [Gammaproteobacteria bacterium]
MNTLNATHAAGLRSWVESANDTGSDFPVQNLPFGIFRRRGHDQAFRGGVAIGDQIVDLAAVAEACVFGGAEAQAAAAAAAPALNALLRLGPGAWSRLRAALSAALAYGSEDAAALRGCLVPQAEAEYALPAAIGDFTDFFSSIHHAAAVARLRSAEAQLPLAYRWMPLGYHGRASSIGISGQRIPRPCGQVLPKGAGQPVLGPSWQLDFELELGAWIGVGNPRGEPVPVGTAETHVFGLALLNDWSARDIQSWEQRPLGPLLGKNFATTVSPWIVTLEALAPYRVPWERPSGGPAPLPYLDLRDAAATAGCDIELEVLLQSAAMRARGLPPQRLARSNYRHAYWALAQLIAHHTVNGCNLRSGDLIGTGTQSGPEPGSGGSLLELTQGGRRPLDLADGSARSFVEDGDSIVMRAWCVRAGAARIGFGELVAEVLPARPLTPAGAAPTTYP